ncbi:MAG: trypsin-like peptidase domain-containing protein [Phycisphaerales bacterium]|nr:trypsin-like peptidase domain-containing protein [Phycisphaerales bacterium]
MTISRLGAAISWIAAMALGSSAALRAQAVSAGGPFGEAIRRGQERVVKIYGGGIGREHGYGSGTIISSHGEIITALSVMLDAPGLRVVLADGRRLPASVTARDERRQLALLKVEATDLPFFELGEPPGIEIGDWVVAAANPFKVAEGAEPVSVAVGIFAGRATIDARRRNQEFPYDGQILLTDVIVSSPGSAGGALLDAHGNLVGVIGKAAFSDLTSTWLNYAMPLDEIAAFVGAARGGTLNKPAADGHSQTTSAPSPQAGDTTWKTAGDLGIRLFTLGGRAKPAYVDSVRAGSAAKSSGLRANDLILSVSGRKTASCDEFDTVLRELVGAEKLELVVKRGEEIVTLNLTTSTGAEP